MSYNINNFGKKTDGFPVCLHTIIKALNTYVSKTIVYPKSIAFLGSQAHVAHTMDPWYYMPSNQVFFVECGKLA